MQVILYKKQHKIKNINRISNIVVGNIRWGTLGLKVLQQGILTFKQLETARRIISRMTQRVGKIIIRIFFRYPKTKKSEMSRMGKGVGSIKKWVAIVKKGTVILELGGVEKTKAVLALKSASIRLPVDVYIIFRDIWVA